MADGFGPDDRGEARQPWLEAVDEVEDRSAPSSFRLVAFILLGLTALALLVGTIFWLRDAGDAGGAAVLVQAPPGPYKIRPQDPGGMDVEGRGDTAFAASEGADPQGSIDVNAVPEAPVVASRPRAAARATTGPATIQLGAFSTEAAANSAWKALSGRFTYLAPLTSAVIPVTAEDKILYRLRASGDGAAALCGRLQVAGETCFVMD